MIDVIEIAKTLINRRSVTPEDAGCQQWIADYLQALGFKVKHLPFGKVKNLWAWRGEAKPRLVFLGHTDVVPSGDESMWRFPPYEATLDHGVLYGRGATDMKGAIAAMLVAVNHVIKQQAVLNGSVAFLITSDEEGVSVDGTRRVVEWLREQGESIDYCLVGEASSEKIVGDTIRIGRRGSLNGMLTVFGKQGHIAYPDLADNPVHKAMPLMQELLAVSWDEGDAAPFPKTSFQFSNVTAGTGANNMIPAYVKLRFNWRFSTATSADKLKARFEERVKSYGLHYQLNWLPAAHPYLTQTGPLLAAVQTAISESQKIAPVLSTAGGTSDGRFVAPMGAEVLELGVLNASAHQIDEHVAVADLEKLTSIYQQVLVQLLS